MARSADISFRIIALKKRILSKERLNQAMGEARQRGVSLESLLSETGEIPPDQFERILRTRRKHGRGCSKCHQVTYLLPGQTWAQLKCEHPRCGGALRDPATAPPAPARHQPAGPSGRPIRPRARRPSETADPRMSKSASSGEHRSLTLREGDEIPPSRHDDIPRIRPAAAAPRVETDEASGLVLSDSAEMPAYTPDELGEPPEPPTWEDEGDDDLGFVSMAPGSQPDAPPAKPPPIPKRDDRRARSGFADAGIGYEPPTGHDYQPAAPKPSTPPDVPEQDDRRARNLRMAGGGFGYEPPPGPESGPESRPEDHPGAAPPQDYEPIKRRPRRLGAAAYEDNNRRPAPGPPIPGSMRTPEKVITPVHKDVLNIFLFPARTKEAFALLSVGALFILIGLKLPWYYLIVALVFSLYPVMYKIRVTRVAMQGVDEPPSWPELEFGEIFGTLFRVLGVVIACFLPACVAFPVAMGGLANVGVGGAPQRVMSIGPSAVKSNAGEPYISPGSKVDTSAELFVDTDDNPISLAGKWTIVGLLGQDRGDDVASEMLQDLPRGNIAVAIFDAYQIHDLDRVALALPDVQVLAAYADPSERIINRRFPWTDDRYGDEDDYEDEDEDEDEDEFEGVDPGDDLARAMRMAERGARINAGGGFQRDDGKPRKLTICKTPEAMTFPAPLDKLKLYPAVVVIDPSGKVVRQYSSGVHDTKLYSDVIDLRRGGDGDVWREKSLPKHAYGIQPEAPGGGVNLGALAITIVAWVAFGVFLIFGCLYYPMAWLMMVAFDSPSTPFMYPAAFRAMAKAWKDYLFLVLIWMGMGTLSWLVMAIVGGALELVLPWFLEWLLIDYLSVWIDFYAALVVAYGVGRFYAANAKQIGWFTSPAERHAEEGDYADPYADPYAAPGTEPV